MSNSVVLKSYANITNEYVAAGAITPGHLIELTTAGTVQVHGNAGQNAAVMVAVENGLEGQGITDAYALNDPVQCWVPQPGDEVYMLLADGENVSIGAFLESNGNGELKEHTPQAVDEGATGTYTIYVSAVRFQALEAKAPSGSSERIKVRVI